MSTMVGDIWDLIHSRAQSILGATWVPMRKVFDPAQNDLRIAEKSFAVRHLAAGVASQVQTYSALTQGFEVILSRRATNRDNEHDVQDVVIRDLYDKATDIYESAAQDYLGNDCLVMAVQDLGFEEPEVLDNGACILRMSFQVIYQVG